MAILYSFSLGILIFQFSQVVNVVGSSGAFDVGISGIDKSENISLEFKNRTDEGLLRINNNAIDGDELFLNVNADFGTSAQYFRGTGVVESVVPGNFSMSGIESLLLRQEDLAPNVEGICGLNLTLVVMLSVACFGIVILLALVTILCRRYRLQNSPGCEMDPEKVSPWPSSAENDTIAVTFFGGLAPVPVCDTAAVQINMLDEILGQGEFGFVRKGTVIDSEQKTHSIVLKTAHDFQKSAVKTAVLKELTLMRGLAANHNVLPIIGFATSDSGIHLVLPLAECGDLHTFLRRSGTQLATTTPRTLDQFSAQISAGLRHIHAQNCVHLDLACRNLLLTHDLTVLISDFGLAESLNDKEEKLRISKALPVRWTAPETLNPGTCSLKTDKWSFGVCLFEIYSCGLVPYGNIVSEDDVWKFVTSGGRLQRPVYCSNEIFECMKLCWEAEPEYRPTANELSVFFDQIMDP